MKGFCKNLKKHAVKIIDNDKKRNGMTNNQRNSIISLAKSLSFMQKRIKY